MAIQPAQQAPVAVATTRLPTGQFLSPLAAPGSTYTVLTPGFKDHPRVLAGFAQSEALSPDGRTLLVLTSGYNSVKDNLGGRIAAESTQFVFVFDVSGATPVQRQVLPVANSYVGLAFAPDGGRFYVPGGGEDNVHVFVSGGGIWAESLPPISLGHASTPGNGISQGPSATGIAVTPDGKRALVANRYHDSITLLDLAGRKVISELDLRPGKDRAAPAPGKPGGEYPNSIAIAGNGTAYVSSERDREIVVLNIAGPAPSVTARIAVAGNPNKMVLNRAQTMLFVASDNADVVSLIDTRSNAVAAAVSTVAPHGVLSEEQARYKGASPDGLALSPDEKTLYVTNRDTNSLAVIALDRAAPAVIGLIPTGWYPSDVRVAADGATLYISNAKTLPGPNAGNCLGYQTVPCPVKGTPVSQRTNEYIENLIGSALQSVPVPKPTILEKLTAQVASNNGFDRLPGERELAVIAALRSRIRHVIYIVKENRTYDQVLGDLPKGNGDASLTEFPQRTTPNQHALATGFVQLDHYFDAGDVSGNGWPWSVAARESDAGARMLPSNYANNGGGGSYDWEGTNRNVNVGIASVAGRIAADPLTPNDPDLLPGAIDVAAPDGPDANEREQGYLWNAALRAGLSVRNYGFFLDLTRYSNRLLGTPNEVHYLARERAPFAANKLQGYATQPDLIGITDPYFRGYDVGYPDFYREREWEREFDAYVESGKLPALNLVRFPADHTGPDKNALDGVDTPEVQVADNDYAVGRLVQKVAASPYAGDTLIFITEDDAQDGPDHVDAHRSIAFVVGPYVKQGALVSTHYTTVNMLRTITDILGADHLGINDANALPMTEVFDLDSKSWTYTASASSLLKSTRLPLPAGQRFATADFAPARDADYWAAATRGLDFSAEDKVDAEAYNRILWAGIMGGRPYPED